MLYILSWNGTLYIVTVEYFSILFLDKIILITKVLRDILSYVKKIFIKNIKNVKGVHYSLHLDEQFTVVFMTVSHSPQMLLKLKSVYQYRM